MTHRLASVLVFSTSFCVLVLEILAGRLLAPLIGVSLETFTGIIGTVLAGIAVGNNMGGRMADSADPAKLVGPTILLGGVLAWLAPILIAALGPVANPDPVTIVFLTAISFFAPAAVLSAVSPMAAKLRLESLDDAGRVVGSLSAAGTVGALAGTFITGFVLVAALPTRTLIFGVGLALVIGGAILTGWQRISENAVAGVLVAGVGLGSVLLPGTCDAETAYACIQVVADPDRPAGRSLVLNGDRNSYIDLDDPTFLDFRYMRLFADVSASVPDGPLQALHLGGAAFTYPRHLNTVRPGTISTVLEIDAELVTFAEQELALEISDELMVVTGDARISIQSLDTDRYDLIVGDAFSGLTIPWHLTTVEFVDEVDRVLTADGLVVANLIDGGGADFARAELATYRSRFDHVSVILPVEGFTDRPRNMVMIASHRPIEAVEVDAEDGRLLSEAETEEFIDGADVLRDDFAPVDQLRLGT